MTQPSQTLQVQPNYRVLKQETGATKFTNSSASRESNTTPMPRASLHCPITVQMHALPGANSEDSGPFKIWRGHLSSGYPFLGWAKKKTKRSTIHALCVHTRYPSKDYAFPFWSFTKLPHSSACFSGLYPAYLGRREGLETAKTDRSP